MSALPHLFFWPPVRLSNSTSTHIVVTLTCFLVYGILDYHLTGWLCLSWRECEVDFAEKTITTWQGCDLDHPGVDHDQPPTVKDLSDAHTTERIAAASTILKRFAEDDCFFCLSAQHFRDTGTWAIFDPINESHLAESNRRPAHYE